MDGFVIGAAALNLGYLVVALIALRYVLRWFDRMTGVTFSNVMETIRENPHAAAVYFGARFLGVCILGSAFLG